MTRGKWVVLAGAAAVVLTICGVCRAPVVKTRKMVGLHVTAIRGSKEGEEYVDPGLMDLGKKLQEKFKCKRLTVIGETGFAANSGIEITTDLAEDLKIRMRWRGVRENVAHFVITVLREKAEIIRQDMKMPLDQPALATGRLDKDILILLMKADLEEED
jgi:hypothetical protein